MIKGNVKYNKANKTKFVFLPKECGFNEGDEVEINFSGIGIYSKEELIKYKEKNKDLFKRLKKIKKETIAKTYDELYKRLDFIGKITGLGKTESEEDYICFENSKYTFCPQGDIEPQDMGVLSDIHFRDISGFYYEGMKKKYPNLKDNDFKQQIFDYAVCRMAQVMFEDTEDDYQRILKNEFDKLGFKHLEQFDEGIWFSNGAIKLIIDGYGTFTITTLRRSSWIDMDEPLLEI
jgi:hypothetical protein